ncbi:hypothetical protein [Janthinobacterium lividum]|uniref:hypothetical protein n=1 Tax=Janthinobacterium lividum TaxID=29581 RepID=UPI0014080267|nr:hypothetical protein [Janthinobacterium lividum]NHQ89720.1 hypothetical protein [Janthinobacterium lividum]
MKAILIRVSDDVLPPLARVHGRAEKAGMFDRSCFCLFLAAARDAIIGQRYLLKKG